LGLNKFQEQVLANLCEPVESHHYMYLIMGIGRIFSKGGQWWIFQEGGRFSNGSQKDFSKGDQKW